jgi:hypothetical protein
MGIQGVSINHIHLHSYTPLFTCHLHIIDDNTSEKWQDFIRGPMLFI